MLPRTPAAAPLRREVVEDARHVARCIDQLLRTAQRPQHSDRDQRRPHHARWNVAHARAPQKYCRRQRAHRDGNGQADVRLHTPRRQQCRQRKISNRTGGDRRIRNEQGSKSGSTRTCGFQKLEARLGTRPRYNAIPASTSGANQPLDRRPAIQAMSASAITLIANAAPFNANWLLPRPTGQNGTKA